MYIAGHRFEVRLWPTLLTVIMLAVLLGLGTWQVQRLHWKEGLIATINQRIHLPAVDLDTALKEGEADYRHVTVSGLFQHDHEFYMTAVSLTGEGGYYVLTPLQLDDGRYILINRGWVPYDKRDPSRRFDGQVFGPVAVTGLLRKPHVSWLQPANDPAGNNWYGVDLSAMAKQAHVTEFVPYVLDADATPNPGGYPMGGQTHIILPNNHFMYALTWYSLALSLVIIYLIQAHRSK